MEERFTATVYYRGSYEHQDPDADKALLDAGHAFIGIQNHQTGETHFLDINQNDQTGHWGFVQPDEQRLNDHHTVSWDIGKEQFENGVMAIEGIKQSTQIYDLGQHDCTDSVGTVIQSMGYDNFSHANTNEFPSDFGARLQDYFHEQNVEFHHDSNMCHAPQNDDWTTLTGHHDDSWNTSSMPDEHHDHNSW